MDYNKKKPHTIIGDVKVELYEGPGKAKVEVLSRHVGSMKPFLYLQYQVTPLMHCDKVAWAKIFADPEGDGEED